MFLCLFLLSFYKTANNLLRETSELPCHWRRYDRRVFHREKGVGACFRVLATIKNTKICRGLFRTGFRFPDKRQCSGSLLWNLGVTKQIIMYNGTPIIEVRADPDQLPTPLSDPLGLGNFNWKYIFNYYEVMVTQLTTWVPLYSMHNNITLKMAVIAAETCL